MRTENLRMNERAWARADQCEADADQLRLAVHVLSNGARVIDAGVEVAGGWQAGLALADICMGGLGHVALASVTIDGESWPGVQVWTDHPAVACMASQYAGWTIDPPGLSALGSGPIRARARVEQALFEKLGYREDGSTGVLVLEGRVLPTEDVVEWVSGRSGLAPSGITVVVAPAASLAGSLQVAARVVETGLHKMDALGFDVRRVTSAIGTAPLSPPVHDELLAIGRTNDCILYGGQVRYVIPGTDEELARLAASLPACTSPDHGTPFAEIFSRYGDFYKIDPQLFSPAEVWLMNPTSGRTFHAGRLEPAVLRQSLFGS